MRFLSDRQVASRQTKNRHAALTAKGLGEVCVFRETNAMYIVEVDANHNGIVQLVISDINEVVLYRAYRG